MADPRLVFNDIDTPHERLSFAIFSAKVERMDTASLERKFQQIEPLGRTYDEYRADYRRSKA